eukprot:SAG25_NODE_348_length_9337_cov_5.975103_2_plen_223_part_00
MPNSRILRNSWNFLKIALNSERISLTTLTYFSAQQNTLQRSYHGPTSRIDEKGTRKSRAWPMSGSPRSISHTHASSSPGPPARSWTACCWFPAQRLNAEPWAAAEKPTHSSMLLRTIVAGYDTYLAFDPPPTPFHHTRSGACQRQTQPRAFTNLLLLPRRCVRFEVFLGKFVSLCLSAHATPLQEKRGMRVPNTTHSCANLPFTLLLTYITPEFRFVYILLH